jgi:phage baseplate assembly protein gpV
MMRREAQRVCDKIALVRMGIVDGYDPSHYTVKVRLQPENILTGWLPVSTPWVGNQWGIYAPPSIGDVVEVHFQQGHIDAGFVVNRFFYAKVQPLAVPSGELWIVHQSGSLLKFHNDGSIEVKANTNVNMTANNLNVTGNVNVTGTIQATGDIIDQSLSTAESMATMRSKYNSHVHPGVQTGSGNTGTTSLPM